MTTQSQQQRLVLGILVSAFFFSGFAALLYQVVWQRMLGLFSGSDVRSVTIIAGAYLAGLGVGSLVGTFYADRLTNRQAVQIYGVCNLGVAAFALISRLLYYDLLFLELNTLARSPTVLLIIVFASLLIPTTLMGISLPLLARALVDDDNMKQAPGLITLLYGLNTLGAGVGTVVSGWYLIGTFGYQQSLFIGAGMSGLVGIVTLWIARRFSDSRQNKTQTRWVWRDVPREIWMWCLLVFASGFIAISLEIIWFRVLDVTLRSTAYTFAHLLAFFLVGDAVGSLVGARMVKRIQNPRRVFLAIQGFVALYSLLSIWGISIAADFYPVQDYIQSSAIEIQLTLDDNIIQWFGYLVLPAIMILPPSFMIGFYFPIVQKAIQTDVQAVGQRVGLVDVANIMGNTLGSILTGLVLLEFLGTADALRLLGIIGLGFVVILLFEQRRSILNGALAAGLVVSILLFPSMDSLWMRLHGAQDDVQFLVAEDSTGVAAIREIEERALIYANGLHQGNIPLSLLHSALGSLPSLIHPNPERILVIGIGSGGTPYSVGVNPDAQEIIAVEIIGSEIDVLEAYAQSENGAVLNFLWDDPRYTVIVGDGRRELQLNDEKFDLIEADAIRTSSSHSGLLYSTEFFEEARAQLTEGGIMAQWRPTDRIEATFVNVFPYAIRVTELLIIGSNVPIDYDPTALLARLQEDAVVEYLERGGVDMEALRGLIGEPLAVWTPDSPRDYPDELINTDLFPRDEYYLNN